MGRDMAWVGEAKDEAQAQVPAPILTVGFLQPAGSLGASGEQYELEAMMIGGGFNDALLAEIGPDSA